MKQHPNKYRKVSSWDSVYDIEELTVRETLFHFYIIYEKIKSIKTKERQPNNDRFDDLRINREFVFSCSIYFFFFKSLVTVHWCIVCAHWLLVLWFKTTQHTFIWMQVVHAVRHTVHTALAQKGATKGRRRKHWYQDNAHNSFWSCRKIKKTLYFLIRLSVLSRILPLWRIDLRFYRIWEKDNIHTNITLRVIEMRISFKSLNYLQFLMTQK